MNKRMVQPIRFSILHTNDLHSLFEGNGPDACFDPGPGKRDPVRGHYARLTALIRRTRAEREARGETVFLVDAGDAEFGALFHILGPWSDFAEMPEYRFFHDLGYDVLGIGNHFFESGVEGLARSWGKVEARGLRLPFLVSNAVFRDPNGTVARHSLDGPQPAKGSAFHRLLVRDVPRPGSGEKPLRIGWMGLVGPYGAKVSLASRSDLGFIGFDDQTGKECPEELHALARTLARELRETHGAEMVVAVFHGGHPEDTALARAVPEIDLVIAGHTHAAYAEAAGRTVVAQAGTGGAMLGCLDFAWEDDRPVWTNPGASLFPVTSEIPCDPQVLAQVEAYKLGIDDLLTGGPFSYATPIFSVDRDLRRRRFPDNEAGVFVASGILSEINRQLDELAEEPVEVFFSSYGLVRSEFLCVDGRPTKFQYSDIFKFFPLGIAGEGEIVRVGTPVHVFWLTRADLKSLLEAMAAVSMTKAVFDPVVSDTMTFAIAWWGIPFYNKIRDLRLRGTEFIPDQSLIRVATDEYFARNLRRIGTLTMGLARAVPRDHSGNELTVFPESRLPAEHDLLALYLAKRGTQDNSIANL